jgi:hypothetical protein
MINVAEKVNDEHRTQNAEIGENIKKKEKMKNAKGIGPLPFMNTVREESRGKEGGTREGSASRTPSHIPAHTSAHTYA